MRDLVLRAAALVPASALRGLGAGIALQCGESIFALQDRFSHFQHRHRELLVWEFPSDLPTLPLIEFNSRCVGLENTKPQYPVTATNYFRFALCQQSLADAALSTFAKHP